MAQALGRKPSFQGSSLTWTYSALKASWLPSDLW
jgi:hypothetical protein